MKSVRIQDSIAYRIQRSARMLRKHFLELAARRGIEISPEQWFILNKLNWEDELTQVELSDAIFSDRPNVTRMVAALEAKGLVRRRADAGDGRKIRVALTVAGRAVHDAFAAAVPGARATLLRGIAEADLRTAARVLEQLDANLAEA